MAMRWFVKEVGLTTAMEEGCEGEPFAFQDGEAGNVVVLTKIQVEVESSKSSTRPENFNVEGNRRPDDE